MAVDRERERRTGAHRHAEGNIDVRPRTNRWAYRGDSLLNGERVVPRIVPAERPDPDTAGPPRDDERGQGRRERVDPVHLITPCVEPRARIAHIWITMTKFLKPLRVTR